MASLLKNQILKHLSKFTKNLSPDKLQLSAFKGSFEVNNIELNEQVLMDLLELPVWMSLTKAHCNYASIKIQWMKLKTVPIYIMLDEVVIEAETCENFRKEGNGSGMDGKFNLNQETGSYGFTNKVIDGITLSINSVVIQFSSSIFSASFELTRITIESRNCYWKPVDDLSKTRIRDPARGQVLLFKHIEWQTLRFVAKSETNSAIGQAPLRLIANQASCRITLKKRLSDCNLLGARIMVIFDDLLWVLTDSQLLSALHFADYLGGLIKRAPRTKTFETPTDAKNSQQAKAKLMNMNPTATSPTKKPSTNQLASSISTLFSQYDFLETSYHLIVRRIEVHLMDDLGPQSERSQCPELSEGGALQMTFLKLLIDLYPYQAVNGSRKHWFRYTEPSANRAAFIAHKLKTFFLRQQANLSREGSNFNLASVQHHLLSRVVVVRLSDYSIGCVSTNSGSSKSSSSTRAKPDSDPPKLIAFDQSALIPGNVNPIYIELNNYFYLEPFDKLNLPLPDTNIFASVAPVRINFEPLTILWINAFFANLRNALIKLQEAFPAPNSGAETKVNLRAEILMPTVVLNLGQTEGGVEATEEQEYSALEVKISRILIYNCDSYIQPDYFRSLEDTLKYFSSHLGFYFEKTKYPWLSCDMKSISGEFVHQISRWFATRSAAATEETVNEKFDIDFWTVNIEPVWVEFKSVTTGRNEAFLEPINLTLWLHQASEVDTSGIDMNVFAKINDPVKVQLKHGQLLALLRLLERIGDFTSMLNYDMYMIQRCHYKRDVERSASAGTDRLYSFDIDEKVVKAIFKNMAIATTVPEVNLFLVLREEEEEDEEEEVTTAEMTTCNGDDLGAAILANGLVESKSPSPEAIDVALATDLVDAIELAATETAVDLASFESIPSFSHPLEQPQSQQPVLVNGNYTPPLSLSKPASFVNLSAKDIDAASTSTRSSSSRRTTFTASNQSFDSATMRVHFNNYSVENDDALSTFSDISADDSDQQSFIAMAMANGTAADDDLFLEDALGVEMAEEISENFKLPNGDDTDTLNDGCSPFPVSNTPVVPRSTTTYIDALQVRLKNVDIIQQSSKGFLSQVFLDTNQLKIDEHQRLTKADYLNLYKVGQMETATASGQEDVDQDPLPTTEKDHLHVTLRIDSFSKGTLRDEMISVRLQNLSLALNKETIDLVVDFFNDRIADKPAPTAVLLENVAVKIIDRTVRMPPAVFTVPKLKLARNKENKWLVELDDSLPKDSPLYNQLLLAHLKVFERNLLFDVKHLISEQDRLTSVEKRLLKRSDSETQQILDQVLNQKELLLQEIELLRKANEELSAAAGRQ